MAARSAGLRTFPIVAVATCGFMQMGLWVFEDPVAGARVFEGIITGIGFFIGGGAILKTGDHPCGTATAASLWHTGAIGIAVAHGLIAIALSLINLVTLRYIKLLEPQPADPEDSARPPGAGTRPADNHRGRT